MRLPLSWLREHVDPPLGAEELAERLTATSTAVEGIHRIGAPDADGNLEAFRVGRVLEAGPHPNADRLRLCRVDVGEPEPAQIVCGAPNVAAGQAVAVAMPGARLPGADRPLKVAKLRGVESRGMILSETELGLGTDSDGIMVLEDGAAPGTPLGEVLPLSETVLELEVTSNRPDLLAVWGLAREVHAVTEAPLRPLDVSEPPADGPGRVEDHASLQVDDPDLCPRYMARVLTDVRVGPSPRWMRARLEAAGMRAISNVVDVTNYVMLLTGQPLHAFDLDRVRGARIVVRRAHAGEPVVTLDGQRRELAPWMLAICDAERPAVIAGIMGAEDVEVGEGTTRILLEAATFHGPTTYETSVTLGLRTESSARFEKGLPPELPERAMAIACRLLVEHCGARLVPGTLDAAAPRPPATPVTLRHRRTDAILGAPVAPEESAGILRRLGCEVDDGPDAHTVRAPMERRADLAREIDLIEEVARVHGLDRLPEELPRIVGHGRRTPAQALTERLTRRAADLGLSEAVTYRMVPEGDADLLRLAEDDARRSVVRIANPISEEMTVMRRSLLPGLLRAVAHNQARQRAGGGLFEAGRTYAPRPDGQADEREWLVAVLFGTPGAGHWRASAVPVDVWAATGLAEALARAARVAVEPRPASQAYGHPVRQAELVAGDELVGWAGEVHPLVLRAAGVAGPVVAVELDREALLAAAPSAPAQFEDLVTVPVSTRDLAVVVPETVRAADLVRAAREAGRPLVRDARVFDRYAGAQVEDGHVSLAIRLSLVDPGRTVTDERLDEAVGRVVAALAEAGARLRS